MPTPERGERTICQLPTVTRIDPTADGDGIGSPAAHRASTCRTTASLAFCTTSARVSPMTPTPGRSSSRYPGRGPRARSRRGMRTPRATQLRAGDALRPRPSLRRPDARSRCGRWRPRTTRGRARGPSPSSACTANVTSILAASGSSPMIGLATACRSRNASSMRSASCGSPEWSSAIETTYSMLSVPSTRAPCVASARRRERGCHLESRVA